VSGEVVVVCDRDARMLRALCVILRKGGYKVQTAATGEEAHATSPRDGLSARPGQA
jgi:DNA-binding response OmpR family regulator